MQLNKVQVGLIVFAQVFFLLNTCVPVLITPAATEPVPAVEATVTIIPELPPSAPSSTPPILSEDEGSEDEEPDTSHTSTVLSASLTPDTSPPDTSTCSPLAVQPLEEISEIITQPFIAPRQLDDDTYKDDGHHGLDLGYYTRNGVNFTGAAVLSATNGHVAAIFHDRPPYGDVILIETPYEQIPAHLIESQSIPPGDSLYVLYAHLQNLPDFSLGQEITCGDPLAEAGLTGYTSGPHLHFETRWGPAGQTFESMAYYEARTTEEERANYVTWRMSGTFRLFDPMILLFLPAEN